jgi:HEPN domain-containing protein
MKACLRAVGVEHPKEHELSEAVMESQNRFPDWMKNQLESLCDASIWLAERCGPAMYGDEVGGLPASQLFTLEDAQIAVQYARKALEVADRLLSELK